MINPQDHRRRLAHRSARSCLQECTSLRRTLLRRTLLRRTLLRRTLLRAPF